MEKKERIKIIEQLFSNPGYHIISDKILSHLDHESLISCKAAFNHMKSILDIPNFWLKKCVQNGLNYELYLHWNQLIQITLGMILLIYNFKIIDQNATNHSISILISL